MATEVINVWDKLINKNRPDPRMSKMAEDQKLPQAEQDLGPVQGPPAPEEDKEDRQSKSFKSDASGLTAEQVMAGLFAEDPEKGALSPQAAAAGMQDIKSLQAQYAQAQQGLQDALGQMSQVEKMLLNMPADLQLKNRVLAATEDMSKEDKDKKKLEEIDAKRTVLQKELDKLNALAEGRDFDQYQARESLNEVQAQLAPKMDKRVKDAQGLMEGPSGTPKGFDELKNISDLNEALKTSFVADELRKAEGERDVNRQFYNQQMQDINNLRSDQEKIEEQKRENIINRMEELEDMSDELQSSDFIPDDIGHRLFRALSVFLASSTPEGMRATSQMLQKEMEIAAQKMARRDDAKLKRAQEFLKNEFELKKFIASNFATVAKAKAEMYAKQGQLTANQQRLFPEKMKVFSALEKQFGSPVVSSQYRKAEALQQVNRLSSDELKKLVLPEKEQERFVKSLGFLARTVADAKKADEKYQFVSEGKPLADMLSSMANFVAGRKGTKLGMFNSVLQGQIESAVIQLRAKLIDPILQENRPSDADRAILEALVDIPTDITKWDKKTVGKFKQLTDSLFNSIHSIYKINNVAEIASKMPKELLKEPGIITERMFQKYKVEGIGLGKVQERMRREDLSLRAKAKEKLRKMGKQNGKTR